MKRKEGVSMKKLSQQQFFSAVAPSASLLYLQGSPIYPSVRLAYSYIKSNGVLIAWNNLTHMQVGNGRKTDYWLGEYVDEHTGQLMQWSGEEVLPQALRAYQTLYHSFVDEDLYFNYRKRRQLTHAKSPYRQTKALIKIKNEDIALIEQIFEFIQLNQLEFYDQAYMFYDIPSYILRKNTVPVLYADELIAVAFYIDDLLYISLRKIQEYEEVKIEKKNGIVRLNGHIVKAFTLDNLCYVSLEDLKKFLLIQVEWDQHGKVLSLY